MPVFSVADVLPLIARKLNGSGVGDISCEPAFSEALEAYNKINRLLLLEQETFAEGHARINIGCDGVFTLDRRIQRILEAKTGCDTLNVVGPNYKFLDSVTYDRYDSVCCTDTLTFLGADFAVHKDPDKPRLLFAVSDRPEENGCSLFVTGTDAVGNDIRTFKQGLGATVPVVFAGPDTPPRFNCGDGLHRGEFASVKMIRKPRTNGYVQLWGLDEWSGEVQWLTTLAPDETSPSLTRYKANGCSSPSILAHVSIQYVPLFDPNDVSLIQQIDAYEAMAQALHHFDTNEYGLYQTYRNTAVSLIRKDRKRKDGVKKALNVVVEAMPLQGRSYSMRG